MPPLTRPGNRFETLSPARCFKDSALDSFSFRDMDRNEYVITEYVTVAPGEPFRLLPFGRLVKNGKAREITAELAGRFRLPHFRPPIKMGSHRDETPAGGHIVALEVREDGLYAVPEYTDEGAAALMRGSYRYHSPEIVWEGGLEDPRTGVMQEGPLIIGDALLHTPHLGEAAALYSADIIEGEMDMTSETVTVPVSWLDRLLGRNPESAPAPQQPQGQPPAAADADRYAAMQIERDDLAAQIEQMRAERNRAARVERFETELAETPLAGDAELPALLADLTDETAAALLRRLRALAEQARVAELTANVGHEGQPTTGDPVMNLDAAIRSVMTKDGLDYNRALNRVSAEQPELLKAAYGR